MKKYVVVKKRGRQTDGEGIMNFTEGTQAFQLEMKKLYDEPEATESVSTADADPELLELRDEMSRTFTFEVDEADEERVIEMLRKQGDFERIEADETNYQYAVNDPLFSSLYGITKIEAEKVWNSGFTGSEIIVAVVDSGIDVNHIDLSGNLWSDGNGGHGFNVINGSTDLTDVSHHGTHVAGTIGALVNNNTGIAGVAPRCSIMAVKGLDGPNGAGSAANLANGIRKAVDHGAKVINNSWGPGRSTDVKKAIEYAHLNNVVVIFAAGNDNRTVIAADAAGSPHVICVSATDKQDRKGTFSNHGQLVTVAAPGVDILSTVPGNNYKEFDGTSMAAPHVSGLAALMLSKNRKLKPGDVKRIIADNSDSFPAAPPVPMGRGRINAARALAATP